jgi:hypothetical protein
VFKASFAGLALVLLWKEVQVDSTIHSIRRRNSKEIQSANRTVSERAVYPRPEMQDKRDCNGTHPRH